MFTPEKLLSDTFKETLLLKINVWAKFIILKHNETH